MTDLPTQIAAARRAYDKERTPELAAQIAQLEAAYARDLSEAHAETPGQPRAKAS